MARHRRELSGLDLLRRRRSGGGLLHIRHRGSATSVLLEDAPPLIIGVAVVLVFLVVGLLRLTLVKNVLQPLGTLSSVHMKSVPQFLPAPKQRVSLMQAFRTILFVQHILQFVQGPPERVAQFTEDMEDSPRILETFDDVPPSVHANRIQSEGHHRGASSGRRSRLLPARTPSQHPPRETS